MSDRYHGMTMPRLTGMTTAERSDYYDYLYQHVGVLIPSLAKDTVPGRDELFNGAEHFAYSAACNAFLGLLDALAALEWIVNPEE